MFVMLQQLDAFISPPKFKSFISPWFIHFYYRTNELAQSVLNFKQNLDTTPKLAKTFAKI